MHSISSTLDKPIKIMVRDRFGHPFRVNRINTAFVDGVLTFDIETAAEDVLLDYQATHIPVNPSLIRFQNRGVWYEVPKMHLQKSIYGLHQNPQCPNHLWPSSSMPDTLHQYRHISLGEHKAFL